MGFVRNTTKKIAFWNYTRTSWQWDVLCVLILVFIFLTPKSWFDNSAYRRTHMGQDTVWVDTDVVGTQLDTTEIERRARLKVGRLGKQVIVPRPRYDEAGRILGYEVDIR
jgi:hypothetical protein